MARAKKKVTCQDCDVTFSRKGDLQQHRREHHSRRNMCLICKRAFESEKRLKMHLQFHNVGGKYKCFYCTKRFNKAWKMKIHLVNHSGRPSYVCEYCGDDFLYPGKIVMHLKRIHDVCYACKDCGTAIPIECSQRPHKCRIYGCKDCPTAFISEEELAGHVNSEHAEGAIGTQTGPDQTPPGPLQGVSPASREEEEDCDVEPVLVVAEETSDASTEQGIGRLSEGEARVMPGQASRVTFQCTPDNGRSGLGHQPVPPKDPCDPGPQCLPGEVRVSWEAPVYCPVPNNTVRGRRDRHDLTLLGRRTPGNLVIRSEEVVEVVDVEDVEDKPQPPSYISSILLRSSSISLSRGFKVPEASTNLWKKETQAVKSLRRKQDELDRGVQTRGLLNTLHLYRDTDARLTQRGQASFESWLTADSFSSPEHDYVFGYEGGVGGGGCRDDAIYHYHYFNKKIPKKEKVDMTFEDLCLF